MNCIVIDDEPLARKGMNLLIDEVPDLHCLKSFENPLLAHEYLSSGVEVDVVFLDIEMPGLSGLEYLSTIPPDAFVILTTAYPQYALEAFELDVIDYLVKPIKLNRFLKAVQKAKDMKGLEPAGIEVDSKKDFVYIKSERKFVKLVLGDVQYIKGLKDYVVIHTHSGKYMTAMNVGTIHKQLPDDQFARVSKSYIINVDYLESVDVYEVNIAGTEIPLGGRYKEEFIDRYVKGKLLKR